MFRFESKNVDDSTRIEGENIDLLCEFILKNRMFLGLTLAVMGEYKKTVSVQADIKTFIELSDRWDESIGSSELYNEYIELMYNIYNVKSNEILGDERGRVLEVVWADLAPYNKNLTNYSVFEEAFVFYNEEKLSENDIDFVFQDEAIELDECKASAKSTLSKPVAKKTIGKLTLMQDVIEISKRSNIECKANIVTFDALPNKSRRLLDRYGYNCIDIICRKDIEAIK